MIVVLQSTLRNIKSHFHQGYLSKLFQFDYRDYLLNVVNTVNANSVAIAVNTVSEQRENRERNEAPIVITNEFAQMLE